MSKPITSELREYAADYLLHELTDIADRIDAQHERRMLDCRREVRRDLVRYLRGVLNDYDRDIKRVRKCDKEEVVRCKDCVNTLPLRGVLRCQIMEGVVEADDYCSHGERRDDANQ